MGKNIKNKPKIPIIKKDLKAFLTNEEGKITKKNIVKLGVSLLIASQALQQSIVKGAENLEFKNIPDVTHQAKKIAFSSHVSHASHASHASHSSHSSHSSHASHGSHGSHSSHSSHASHGSHGSHASHGSHGSHSSHSSHASHGSHGSHSSHSSHSSHASHSSHTNCCCGTTGYSYASV